MKITAKFCFKCNKEKLLSDFYKHPNMPDGHVNKCKECNKKDIHKNYNDNRNNPEWMESERARGRDKHKRLYSTAYKEHIHEYFDGLSYNDRYPEKYKAKIVSQRIKKEDPNNERHHWSYNEEHYKDTIELSKKDHMKSHRFIIYDSERFMYRRYDTNELLDTKQSHLEFITEMINKQKD